MTSRICIDRRIKQVVSAPTKEWKQEGETYVLADNGTTEVNKVEKRNGETNRE